MSKQDVHLYVFDSLSDWEASYAIAGINNPQFQKNPGSFRIQTVALGKNTITTVGGVCIKPDLRLEELAPLNSAMLILPGGTAWDAGMNAEIIEIARMFLDSAKPVAAICGATGGLARAGLLDNRKHTSNAAEYLATTQYKGAALYEEASAVTDNNLITASGMAPLDFAYHVFKCLDIYTQQVLEAWYGLYKTGQSKYFEELMSEIST
jgi:putative intracellular protease/amidase